MGRLTFVLGLFGAFLLVWSPAAAQRLIVEDHRWQLAGWGFHAGRIDQLTVTEHGIELTATGEYNVYDSPVYSAAIRATNGVFTSTVHDAETIVDWSELILGQEVSYYDATSSSSLLVEVRTGSETLDGIMWSAWQDMSEQSIVTDSICIESQHTIHVAPDQSSALLMEQIPGGHTLCRLANDATSLLPGRYAQIRLHFETTSAETNILVTDVSLHYQPAAALAQTAVTLNIAAVTEPKLFAFILIGIITLTIVTIRQADRT